MTRPTITIQRIYDERPDSSGRRILVDRLWPRGVTKERANLDLWLKDIAPSAALRKWFHEGNGDWAAFRSRYIEELRDNPAVFRELLDMAEREPVVLLYAVRDEEHNHAAILRDLLNAHAGDDEDGCTDCLW